MSKDKKKDGEFQGGVDEAAKLLEGLGGEAQSRILDYIDKKDPALAKQLENKMVVFEDLKHLTMTMMMELMRTVKIEDLSLALRIGSEELRKHFFGNLSSGMVNEIKDVLNGPPKPVSEVEEAKEKVMTVVREMVKQGKLIFNSNEKMV